MAWQWSHSSEAYDNARRNIDDLSTEQLQIILAEILAHRPIADDADFEGFSPSTYEREYESLRGTAGTAISRDTLIDSIWDFASEQQTCDNGGFNAWLCPYGCHTVSFSLNS